MVIGSTPPLPVKPAGGPAGGTAITCWITICVTATAARQRTVESRRNAVGDEKIVDSLKRQSGYGPLFPAVVTSANAREAVALLANGDSVSLTMEGVRWARRFISDTQQGGDPRKVNDVVQAGQQIWVRKGG